MGIDPLVVVTVFGVVFLAELPDKTMFATLVLSTRYPPALVWVGAAGAFTLQCLIAVAAGGLLSLAPERLVAAAAAVLFAVGAGVLLRGGADPQGDGPTLDPGVAVAPTARRALTTSFAVLFVSEWGDLSQLTTAGLAAGTGEPLSVFLGAVLGLWAVAGLAVLSGRAVLRVVPLGLVRRLAGCALAVLAVAAAVEAIRG